jgi:hypothetical protein
MSYALIIVCYALFLLIGQSVLLALQVRAYRLTRHHSLRIVAFATVCAIAATPVAAVPYVIGVSERAQWIMMLWTVGFGVLQMSIGLWGAVALFRSYIELTNACQTTLASK